MGQSHDEDNGEAALEIHFVFAFAAAALCDAGRLPRLYSGGGLAELVADISCELTFCDLLLVQSNCNLCLLPSAVTSVPKFTLAMLILADGFSAVFLRFGMLSIFQEQRIEATGLKSQSSGSVSR